MVRLMVVSSRPSTGDSPGVPTTSTTSGPKAYRCRRYASIFFCVGDGAVGAGSGVACLACCARAPQASVPEKKMNERLSAVFTRTSLALGDELLSDREWPAKAKCARGDLQA